MSVEGSPDCPHENSAYECADCTRDAVLEEAAQAVENHGRPWVLNDDAIVISRHAARIRSLKSKPTT